MKKKFYQKKPLKLNRNAIFGNLIKNVKLFCLYTDFGNIHVLIGKNFSKKFHKFYQNAKFAFLGLLLIKLDKTFKNWLNE